MEIVRTAAVGLTALSVLVAAYAIWRNWRTGVLQRTSTLLSELCKEDETKRMALWHAFPDRFKPKPQQMTGEEANRLHEIADHPEQHESADYKKWNAARGHLNEMEEIAFAYVHELVDRDILAASQGEGLQRSAYYFEPLIEKLRADYPAHPWLVIYKAVELMERRRRLK